MSLLNTVRSVVAIAMSKAGKSRKKTKKGKS